MRTTTIALATVLAAAALSANAAPRTESLTGPFTYEVLGATPTLTFGRARAAAPEAVAPKPATAASGTAKNPAGAAVTPLTYDALGATPHVELKKPPRPEAQASQPAR